MGHTQTEKVEIGSFINRPGSRSGPRRPDPTGSGSATLPCGLRLCNTDLGSSISSLHLHDDYYSENFGTSKYTDA
jgi:hypothetical protein